MKDLELDDKALRIAQAIIDEAHKKYQEENSCPECGSHDVDCDILYICGPHSSWVEWCNTCGWKRRVKT